MKEKVYVLSLDGDAFSGLKRDFNLLLSEVLSTMTQKDGEKADLRLALKITLVEAFGDDGKLLVLPKFEHKVSTSVQYKRELDGFVGGPDYELAYDSVNEIWIMRPVEDKQMNLFEEEYEDV